MQPLSLLMRLYIYAMHGVCIEIIYTGLWDLLWDQDLKFEGNSHLWAFLIYGVSILVIEQVSPVLRFKYNFPLVLRCAIYTAWTYFWEFSTGFVLRQFNACPWDYEPWFDWNFMGLITLEYLPLWFIGSIVTEQVLIKYTKQLRWVSEAELIRISMKMQ